MYIGGDLPYFHGANSVLIACIDHTPSPVQGVLIVSIGWEGAQSGRWSGRTARGEGARWEGERYRGNCLLDMWAPWWSARECGKPCSAEWPRIANG